MTGNHDERPLAVDVNPFSPTAVAPVVEFDSDDLVTVETDAIRQAVGHVSDYLTATSAHVGSGAPAGAGNVIAIVGDFGTGKTHLVMQLLQYARRVQDVTVHPMYLDATADTFLALYHRFIQKLELSEVRTRVSEYYADIVADSLQTSDLTANVAQWLRDREVAPEDVVEQLGLMESALLRAVQGELKEVTSNEAFGIALTLLLRPGFDKAVWTWLTGGQPDQVLVERGITEPIDTEAAALEAMGVFALLYGRKRHRFLLVIDELERVLSAANQPQADVSAAFQKLLTVMTAAGAFLVLSGVPDFLQTLPSNVRQRIGRVITMPGLSRAEVCRFIEQSQQQVFNEKRLEPFTEETVDYLVRVAGGTARKIIQLCYYLYRKATDERTLVTDSMVRDVAREHFALMNIDDVGAEVRRRLQAGGWPYSRNHVLGATRIDYWVPMGGRDAGCAVLLTDSVLDGDDVDKLTRRAAAVRGSVQDSEVLLVVNGVLSDNLAIQLGPTFSTEPLVYDTRSFADDFSAALAAMGQRLQGVAGDDPMTVVRERVEQINRQQSSIYGFVEQLAAHLDGLQSSSDRQFGAIKRELDELSVVVSGSEPGGAQRSGTERPPPGLPDEVDRHFRDALDTLEGLTRPNTLLLDEAFTQHEGDLHRADETRNAIQRRLRSQEFFEAIGVASLLRGIVLAFRDAVGECYRSHTTGPPVSRPGGVDTERLYLLCRTYDAIIENVAVVRLYPLIRLGPEITGTADPVDDVTGATRRSDWQKTFDNLGLRVQQTAQHSVDVSAD